MSTVSSSASSGRVILNRDGLTVELVSRLKGDFTLQCVLREAHLVRDPDQSLDLIMLLVTGQDQLDLKPLAAPLLGPGKDGPLLAKVGLNTHPFLTQLQLSTCRNLRHL